jgi:HPt (histidine-containing phosphotransfer) domain-containing protein
MWEDHGTESEISLTQDDRAARLQRAMVPVRERFQRRCADDLTRLRAGVLSDAELHAIAHRLAGMSLTMGFPELGRVARSVDDILTEGGLPTDEQMTGLETAMAEAAIKL